MRIDRAKQSPQYGVKGFSLIEILTVLVLSTMVLSAAILIFSRVRTSAAAINTTLDRYGLPEEILQKIAEDIDRLASPGFDATISLRNKVENGYNSAQLTIENKYYGNGDPPKADIYERVVWQSSYDPETDRLVLYRSHSGVNMEDKIVNMLVEDKGTERGKQELAMAQAFVPICPGLTHFYIGALTGAEEPQLVWADPKMPNGIVLGLSFAPLIQLEDGSFYLPEESIVYRAVAVDRMRPIAYKFVAKTFDADPNALDEKTKDPNDPNTKAADPNSAMIPKKDDR